MVITSTFFWAALFMLGLGLETWQGYTLAVLAFVRFGSYVVSDYRRASRSAT
jgi:hypothetical protein